MMTVYLKISRRKFKKWALIRYLKCQQLLNEGVDAVMKEAARMLKEIPVTELEISEDEMYIPEEKRFTYEITVEQ